jgi:hypothetical protein
MKRLSYLLAAAVLVLLAIIWTHREAPWEWFTLAVR